MKKKKTKERPVSGEAPRGFGMRVREMDDGTWTWELSRWGAKVVSGTADSQQVAEARLGEEMGKRMLTAKQAQMRRGELLQRLRYWLERRTYIVMHVLYMLENDTPRAEVVSRAEVEEKTLWRQDKRFGRELPLPKEHHRTKPAFEVAGLCYDYCVQLGLTGKRAVAWGTKVLGKTFAEPTSESSVEVIRVKRDVEKELKKQPAHVEDEDDDAPMAGLYDD